ncbi:MAG: recombinase family protein [Pseudomonadota bacterium]
MRQCHRRCAIYTRKSSDEGLDQEFNSLEAQHEACAAYVASQKGEGWKLSPNRYDDGGHSGGTLQRPALQRLLGHIKDGLIDLIVVYKVDRLTRSLADFTKLVDRFDAVGASFVSVTQQFNTATSMGRLTLNVLLSFAQFEREVTAERIRDKIAASKKKGLWMGGLPPLGYDAHERTLVINEPEAKTVRKIFQLYQKLGSVREVKEQVDQLGLVSKKHRFATGRVLGGVPLSRGRLYHLLSNPIYVGQIRHKDKSFPGQHPRIIDAETFAAVNTHLKSMSHRTNTNSANGSPLAGKFVDETGDPLTPSHATKNGRRHRYYLSRRLITQSGKADLNGWRLPADQFERAVANLICENTDEASKTSGFMRSADPETIRKLPAVIESLITGLKGPERSSTLKKLVSRGSIATGQMSIWLNPESLAERLQIDPSQIGAATLRLEGRFVLRRRGVEAKLIMGNNTSNSDATLIKTIAQGWAWFEELKRGKTMAEIAERHGISQRRVAHLVDLAFLAPDLVKAILAGKQSPTLTADRLVKSKVPLSWKQQQKMIEAN